MHLRKRCTERKTAQEATGAFLTVTSKRVHWLVGAGSGPGSGCPAMNLVKWSGILGVIYLGVCMRVLENPNRQPTIVKDRASAADRVDGAPPKRERLCSGLLAHDVGKERRGGGGWRNSGHFWGIRGDGGADRV